MNELIVFTDAEAASLAGFQNQVYPGHNHIKAWWPELGCECLYGRALQRVTITADAAAVVSDDALAVMKHRTSSFHNPIIMKF